MAEDLHTWAKSMGLSEKTVQVLVDEDFTTMGALKDLPPEDVNKCFQTTRLLPARQCLLLEKALSQLASSDAPVSHGDPSHGVTPHKALPATSTPSHGTRQEQQRLSLATGRSDSEVDPLAMTQPQAGHVKTAKVKFEQLSPTPQEEVKSTALHNFLETEQDLIQTADSDNIQDTKSWTVKGFYQSGRAGLMNLLGKSDSEIKEEFRFIMLGKTGSGKSTTGNSIMGEDLFPSGLSFTSVTDKCDLRRTDKHGIRIEILDCPGLCDTAKTQEDTSTTIVQAVACTHPGPHAVLYIVRVGRFTAEEIGVYKRLKALFDDEIVNYMIVLFTGGDDLKRQKMTTADLIKSATPELVKIIEECGHRVLVFDNTAKDMKPQVKNLLDQVRQMKTANRNEFYTCPKYGEIGEGLEKEVKRRLIEVEKKDQEREKYVQELETRAKEAEDAIDQIRGEMNKKEHERQLELERNERDRKELETMLKEKQMSAEQGQEAGKPELGAAEKKQLEQYKEEMQKDKEEREEIFKKQREELMKKIEEEREKERQELLRKEREKQELDEKRRQEEKTDRERKERAYQEAKERLQDGIANNEEQGWIDWAAGGVAKTIAAPFKAAAAIGGWLFS